jgi:site-specific DNA recombinase
MPRAVVYCRVSTQEQTKHLSLPTQRRLCEDYCRREGFEVDRIFMEAGESAKTADRTELKKLIAYCREKKRRIDFVVVHSLSRFARETRTHHALTGLLAGFGIALRSVSERIDGTPAGRLMESIFSSLAQFDNDVKAERTVTGMREALSLGRWTFQAPMGYLTGPEGGPSLIRDSVRGDLVLEAFTEFASGRLHKRELVRRLALKGLQTRRGRPLSPQRLGDLLRNPLYAGRVEVREWGVAARGDFEPLVPETIFDRVQALLAGRRKAPSTRTRCHPDFPLRGLVRHAACGKPLTASWSRGRGGRYPYYHCRACRGALVGRAALEGAFRDLLVRLQPRPEYVRLFNAVVLDVWKGRQQDSRVECARLEQRVAALRQRCDDLDDAFLYRRAVDQQTYERQRDLLREQVAFAEADLEEAKVEELDVAGLLAFAQQVLTDAARLWEQAAPDQKQRLQRVLFPQGLVFDGAGFGTPVTCLAFVESALLAESDSAVASPTGFEPVSPP